MNRSSISIIVIFFLLLIVNIPPIKWLGGNGDCQYATADGSFTFEEMNFNSRDYDMGMRRFQHFKLQQPKDTILYRLCPMNILYVWKYGDYIFSSKYRLPYKSWNEIEKRRGPLGNKTGFQDF